MASVNYTVVLDLTDNGCIQTGWRLKQGDSGNSTIIAKVVNNGVDAYDPNVTPEIAFKRADGNSVLSTMTASDGYYVYTFVGNELAVAGPVVMDVTLTDEEARTSTASCRFEVVADPAGYDPEGAHTYDNPVSVLVERATEDALIAEGFAVGQQRGQDVPESSPYYHNNAKYYSELSDPTAFANMSDVDFNNLQNGQVPVYNSTSGKWENSSGGGGASALNDLTDVTITSASNGQVLKYDSANSKWINSTDNGAVIDDSTTSASKVWSSSKTNTELSSKEDAPTILTSTLSSGSTSLTFSNAAITTTAMYDVYADKYGLTPTDITITTGQAVLTFASQSTNVSIKLVIR